MPRSGSAAAAAAAPNAAAPAAVAAVAVSPTAAPEAFPPSAGNSNSSAATNAAAALVRKLFVGGTGEVDDDTFRDHFAQFGEIEDCVLLRKDGVSRGFGFVTFADEVSVEKALAVTVSWYFSLFFASLVYSTRGQEEREMERWRALLFPKTHARARKKNLAFKKKKKSESNQIDSTRSTASRSSSSAPCARRTWRTPPP